MASFIVEGGHRLHGSITPAGAKNEALQVLSAVLLTSAEVVIDNLPDILDVNNLIDLLAMLGVRVQRDGKRCACHVFTIGERILVNLYTLRHRNRRQSRIGESLTINLFQTGRQGHCRQSRTIIKSLDTYLFNALRDDDGL